MRDFISQSNVNYYKVKELEHLICLNVYTIDAEFYVVLKLIAMIDENSDRNDRDYIDISAKSFKKSINYEKLNEFIAIWKGNIARKNEISKFDKALNRWNKG